MNTTALKNNDKKMREIITELSNLPCSNEHLLLSFCILNQQEITPLNKYPYILEFEYALKVDNEIKGKGDLLLSDHRYNLLVVEVKYLVKESGKQNRSKRNTARNKVYQQAIRYRDILLKQYPDANIGNYALTNELIDNNQDLAERFKIFREQKKEKWFKRKEQLYPKRIANKI